MKDLDKIKKDFKSWSGFDLEGDTIDDMASCVKTRHWDLECELAQQADTFISRLSKLEDNE